LPNPEPTASAAGRSTALALASLARLSCTIAALPALIGNLAGWRRHAAAFAAGALSVLAMAPFHAWPVLFVTLPSLIWLLDGVLGHSIEGKGAWRTAVTLASLRAAAAVGWWFGFGYFVAGLYWVGAAFLVEAKTFAFLLPLAVTGLPAALALFYALAAVLALPFWRSGAYRVLALALSLSAMEYARGHAFTGFPWNVLGYALTYPVSLLQSAALFGIYGLTLIACLMLPAPLVLLAAAPAGRRRQLMALAIAVLPPLLAASAGHLRLARATPTEVPGVKLRLVQPSVPQAEKWRPENQEWIFLEHLRLSANDAAGNPDGLAGIRLLIWPEAAMPFLPLDHPPARAAIGRLLPPDTVLIAGALRAEMAPEEGQGRRFFNSLLVFGDGGRLLAHYDKVQLVPFGEYLPLQSTLEALGLEQLTRRRGGFATGPFPRPLLHLPGLPPLAALICYEAIFPTAVATGGERAGLLVNLTNDGWFGNSTGPRQHLQQARVRAVEQGLPLLRAANNGISAVIDGYGRLLVQLDLDQRGSADAALPAALPPTPYARFGDGIFALLWLAGAGVLVLAGWRRGRPSAA